jgi:hypothetical protein
MASVRKRPVQMPVFSTIEDEAAYWDQHSTAAFEDEWEPVDSTIAPDVRSKYLVEMSLTLARSIDSERRPNGGILMFASFLDHGSNKHLSVRAENLQRRPFPAIASRRSRSGIRSEAAELGDDRQLNPEG